MPRVMNKIRLFYVMTSATYWLAIAEIASAADAADQTSKELPNLTNNRLMAIGAVILLMAILFWLLFQWWRKVEQSSYLGMRFRETIIFNETSRLCAPIEAAWNGGMYWQEILQGASSRAERWLKDHPRREPDSDLWKLAREVQREWELTSLQQGIEIFEIGMGSWGVSRMPRFGNPRPGSGDGFSKRDPWGNSLPGTPDPTGYSRAYEPRKLTPEEEEEEKKKQDEYLEKLNDFRKELNDWKRQAHAWAYQRYEEDLETAKKDAEKLTSEALKEIDFSAIRGRGPEFTLEFTAVVVIIFAAVILGVAGQLSNEQIGTLLAAIACYVLAKSSTRGSKDQVQVVSGEKPKTGSGDTAPPRAQSKDTAPPKPQSTGTAPPEPQSKDTAPPEPQSKGTEPHKPVPGSVDQSKTGPGGAEQSMPVPGGG